MSTSDLLERVKQQRKRIQEEAAKRKTKFFQFKDGRNKVRILPPLHKGGDFFRNMGQHWGLGPDGKSVVYCPQVCHGQPCPICEWLKSQYAALDNIADEVEKAERKKVLDRISATPRYYVSLVDLKDPDKGVQVANLPRTVMEEIFNIMVDDEVGIGDVTDPDKGFDILVDRSGTGLGTEYSVRAVNTPTPLPDKSVLANIVDLEALVASLTYQELQLVMNGADPKTLRALPAPPTASAYDNGQVIDVPAPPPTPQKPATPVAPAPSGMPACFGSFNEADARCQDCVEQDDCEAKMLQTKAAASAVEPPPQPATATAPAASNAEVDELMAAMQSAIDGAS